MAPIKGKNAGLPLCAWKGQANSMHPNTMIFIQAIAMPIYLSFRLHTATAKSNCSGLSHRIRIFG
ncbi:MAG: hypothetical protein K2K97_07955, partial [Muribaculaceae bacterium]|nr:hypothetical protein [Muribaculaceae bacterium]